MALMRQTVLPRLTKVIPLAASWRRRHTKLSRYWTRPEFSCVARHSRVLAADGQDRLCDNDDSISKRIKRRIETGVELMMGDTKESVTCVADRGKPEEGPAHITANAPSATHINHLIEY